ncbi:myosin-heavy-chain kinase [Angomonas deanei]|uniref:Alpha-kinase family, putative n=1 Tax=Angomonas deanei TaxID=59799 RepID=A0A7G2BZY0_9TRYP|nr:myosin-heavy-chain kinase [Angomonas deanei]CAD2213020.1 Alpha-kinase family, putative [Angomonas deanei]|eukprot:EPY29900.1 myosin-heavy-chain kinase [Angomonas deanei]
MGAPTMIRIPHPNRGLAQGGMRACFEVFEVSDDGLSTAMVAKLFRRTILEVSERDYFNEGEIQKTCQVFLKEFSNALKKTGTTGVTPLSYIDSVVVYIPPKQIPEPMRNVRKGFFSYKTENTREFLFTMEPKLEGHFTKYTSNDGAVFYSNEVRQAIADHNARLEVLKTCEAFSHFTLEESGGSMLVCDLQGVQSFLTDPQIHTIDGECFGMGNMGAIGMQRWLARHKCNDICKKMGLKSCEKTTLKRFDNVEKREKYFKKAQANYKKSAPPLA